MGSFDFFQVDLCYLNTIFAHFAWPFSALMQNFT